MLRIQNNRSNRSAKRNTNPDTSRLPKNKQEILSFDIISILLGKISLVVIHIPSFIQILPLPVTTVPSWRNKTSG